MTPGLFDDIFEEEVAPSPAPEAPAAQATAAAEPDLFGDILASPEPAADPSADPEAGRLKTAAGQVVRGFGNVLSSIPKSMAIGDQAAFQRNKKTLDWMERIDKGEAFDRGADPDLAEPTVRELLGYQTLDADRRTERRQDKLQSIEHLSSVLGDQGDARGSKFYTAGRQMDEYMSQLVKTNPNYREEFWAGKVPQGVGSTLGFALTTVGSGGGGAALSGAASGSVDGFEDALNKGATLEQASDSAKLNAYVGTTEALPITKALDRLDKGTGGQFKRAIVNLLKSGTEEALQEGGQTFLSNLIASDVVKYDPDRKLFTGTGDAAGVGFTSGGLLSFLGTLIAGRRARISNSTPPASPETTTPAPVAPSPAASVQEAAPATVAAPADVVEQPTSQTPAALPPEPVATAQADDVSNAQASQTPAAENDAADLFGDLFAAPTSEQAPAPGVESPTVTQQSIDRAANEAATSPQNDLSEPTDAQKESGNYAKGHVSINGLNIAIENPAGSSRRPEWKPLVHHYGYIKGTVGKDKDHLDVFIGPNAENAKAPVYVVDQIDPKSGKFDEHKIMLGFQNESEARQGYQANYEAGWQGLGAVKEFTLPEFKLWLKAGNTKRPLRYKPSDRQAVPNAQAPITESTTAAAPVTIAPARAVQQLPNTTLQGATTNITDSSGVSAEPRIIDFEQFANENSASRQAIGDPALLKNLQGAQKRLAIARMQQNNAEIHRKRDALRVEYDRQVKEGKIRAPADVSSKPSTAQVQEAAPAVDKPSAPVSTTEAKRDDRRSDDARRKKVSDMSPEEMRASLLTDVLTGLPNRRAYDEAEKKTVQVAIDVDSLKYVNDNLGHESGDRMLQAVGQALREQGLDAFHISGDEFMVQGEDAATLEKEVQAVVQRLEKARLFGKTKDGVAIEKTGVHFSYGIGGTRHEADIELSKHKETREAEGLRAPRGETPPGITRVSEGKQTGADRTPPDRETVAAPPAAKPVKEESKTPSDEGVSASGAEKLAQSISAATTALTSAAKELSESAKEIRSARTRDQTPAIEDFGQTIEGARKHYAQAYRDSMKDAMEADIASEPLSKSWPEPDYQKLLDEGSDAWTVAFVHAARDEVPVKPRQSWRVRGWVEQVKLLREFSHKLLTGEITKERVKEALSEPKFARASEAVSGRVELYQAVGHENSLKGVRISVGQYSYLEGKKIDPPKNIWTVEKKAAATAFSNWPTVLASGDTREQAIANFKKEASNGALESKPREKQVSFSIYSYPKGSKAGKYFVGKKVGKTFVDLESFDDAKKAREYLVNNQDKLVEKLERMKALPSERREENTPRVGTDHRNGADVTPEQFHETFGFRGVQFGNYVESQKRQRDLNDSYDALLDLAGVLDVPAKSLSLNGELALAFGARGKGAAGGGFSAHYEPGHIVINLTKNRGAGSLAHEWWHALDNYFSRARGDKAAYVTESPRVKAPGDTRVRPEMIEAFKLVSQTVNESGLMMRSQRLDQQRIKSYWATGREMSARAFESYVIEKLRDQSASNDYLANIVSQEYWDAAAALGLEKEGTYPYPEAAELPAVRRAFDEFFRTVETKETETGVALYSRGATGEGLTVSRAREILSGPISKLSESVPVEIVQSIGDLKVEAPSDSRGVYHNGKVWLVADNLTEANARPTLIHEVVGHLGLEQMLGPQDYGQLLRDVNLMKVSGNKAIQSAAAYVFDHYGKLDRKTEAKEILAYLAENGIQNSLIRRIVAAVRRFLTKIGLGDLPTVEIEELIAKAARFVEKGESQAQPAEAAPAYARGSEEKTGAEHIEDGIQRIQLSAYERAKNNVGEWSDKMLGVLALKHLADIGKTVLPHIGEYVRVVDRMQARKNALQSESGKIADRWIELARKSRNSSNRLASVMHDSTIAGIDPSETYKAIDIEEGKKKVKALRAQIFSRSGEDSTVKMAEVRKISADIKQERSGERKKQWDSLRSRFNSLPAEYQDMFREVRNHYQQRADETLKALIARIQNAKGNAESKRKIIDRLRTEYESRRVEGPYFPLARFGEHFLSVKDYKGEPRFEMFETVNDLEARKRFLEKDGATGIKVGSTLESASQNVAVNASFMGEIAELLDEVGGAKAQEVKDDIYQLYLRTLPELSTRKAFIHRKRVQGYSQDAIRAFAHRTFHAGSQLARLESTDLLEASMEQMEKDVRESPDSTRSAALLNEMRKRHQWVMNPGDSKVANTLTGLGFIWYLGVSPAAAAVNLTQTAIVGFPVLAGRFGVTKSFAALNKAVPAAFNSGLSADEQKMLDQLERDGVIDTTQAHDLAGLAGADSSGYNPAWRRAMQITSWGFHKAEVFNRVVTSVAAYRLARERGQTHDAAVEVARDVTWESHFDYSNTNRARFMQPNIAKVILLFKQYSLNISYFLARNAYLSLRKSSTREERREAITKILGSLAMTSLFAGATGLPLYSVVSLVANSMMSLFGDDDEPYDFSDDLYRSLNDEFGEDFARIVMRGFVNESGFNVASRVKLDELWVKSPDEEDDPTSAKLHYATQILGPVLGIGFNAYDGWRLMKQGHYTRGIEKMIPKFGTDLLKAARFADEGARNVRGDSVVDEFDPWELLGSMSGFQPTQLADQYDSNNRVMNVENRLQQRRQRLLDAYWLAYQAEDRDGMQDVKDAMDEFDAAHPDIKVRKDINRSIRQRKKFSLEQEGGIVVDRKYRKEVEPYK